MTKHILFFTAISLMLLPSCAQIDRNNSLPASNSPTTSVISSSPNNGRTTASLKGWISKTDSDRLVRKMLARSKIDALNIESVKLKSASEKVPHKDKSLSDDLTVYSVTVKGDIEWPFPGGGEITSDGEFKRDRGTVLTMTISPENGRIIAASMTSKAK